MTADARQPCFFSANMPFTRHDFGTARAVFEQDRAAMNLMKGRAR
jgi:hypothetical protein